MNSPQLPHLLLVALQVLPFADGQPAQRTFVDPMGVDSNGQSSRIWAFPDRVEYSNDLTFCLQEGYKSFTGYEDDCLGQDGSFDATLSGWTPRQATGQGPGCCYQMFSMITCSEAEPSQRALFIDPTSHSIAGTAPPEKALTEARIWACSMP